MCIMNNYVLFFFIKLITSSDTLILTFFFLFSITYLCCVVFIKLYDFIS